jgi:hypothetical protein
LQDVEVWLDFSMVCIENNRPNLAHAALMRLLPNVTEDAPLSIPDTAKLLEVYLIDRFTLTIILLLFYHLIE